MVLGIILMTFGDLGGTFCGLGRHQQQALNSMDLQGFPGGAQILALSKVGGRMPVQLGYNNQITNILAVKCKLQGCKISNLRI